MTTHQFRIKASLDSRESVVELDGKPLEGVVRVSFDLSANDITTLKLEIVGEVIVDGVFEETAVLSVTQAKLPAAHG